MPELLTRKEFDKRKNVEVIRPAKKADKNEGAAKPAAPLVIFQFVHPDGEGDYEDIVYLDGKPYHRKLVHGTLYTDKEPLKDYLLKLGWQLLGSKTFSKP